MSDLFNVEKKVISTAEEIIKNEGLNETPLLKEYSTLLSNYKKLYKQVVRLIKINDKQSNKLTSENMVLEEVSMHDELTGIFNRRSFNTFFNNEWKQGVKTRNSLAMLVVDIDFFKSVNDTFGHQAGDDILVQVALVVQGSARRGNDIAARYGGEEFVLLLPSVNEGDAKNIAEKLRAKVENLNFKLSNENVKVTISIGVSAIIPENILNSEILFHQADMALYSAKKTGRNKVCVYKEVLK